MIEIYGREGCERCAQTKKTLTEKNLEFTEYGIGQDVTRESVVTAFPDQRQLPIIVRDGVVVELKNITGD